MYIYMFPMISCNFKAVGSGFIKNNFCWPLYLLVFDDTAFCAKIKKLYIVIDGSIP